MGKRGPKPLNLPRAWKTRAESYAMLGTSWASMARSFGVSQHIMDRWRKERPDFVEVVESAWERRRQPIVQRTVADALDDDPNVRKDGRKDFFKFVDPEGQEAARSRPAAGTVNNFNAPINVAVLPQPNTQQIDSYLEEHGLLNPTQGDDVPAALHGPTTFPHGILNRRPINAEPDDDDE